MAETAPAASSRPGRRWPSIAGLVAVAVVAAVLICEALGWPFLVSPMQRWVSQTLDRRVTFETGATQADVRIGLLGSIRLRTGTLEIAAPEWGREPFFLKASNVRLALRYFDLWRAYRGAALHVRRLEADRLDLKFERRSDGGASWQFGAQPKKSEGYSPRLPTFGELRVGDGTMTLKDAVEPADLDAHFALREGSSVAAAALPGSAAASAGASNATSATSSAGSAKPGPGAAGLQLQATGYYRKLPLKIDLQTTSLLALTADDITRLVQPFTLDATVGHSTLTFRGSATDPLHMTGLRGHFSVSGPSLAAVGDPLGVTLPTTPAFRTRGYLDKSGDVWKAVIDEATIGSSRLNGTFTFDRARSLPLLAGRLGGSRLLLADLGPSVGAAPRRDESGGAPRAAAKPAHASGRVLPDRRFDLPSLRKMDANVLIDIDSLDLGTSLLEPLRPLRTHLQLTDGVLTLANIEARTAEGRLEGDLRLDGRQARALWSADLRLLSVQLQRWIHQDRGKGEPPYVAGLLDTQIKVNGAGRSTAEILGSLDGTLRMHVRDGRVSHFGVEVAGIDIAHALGILIQGDKPLQINCNVADLKMANGVARPQLFVIDTDVSTIWISGDISLARETLALTAFVSPKDFSPFTVRSPIHVNGTFAKPAVSLDASDVGARVGAAALLALLNPLAAVLPFIDPGAKADARHQASECAAVAQRVNATLAPAAKRKPATSGRR